MKFWLFIFFFPYQDHFSQINKLEEIFRKINIIKEFLEFIELIAHYNYVILYSVYNLFYFYSLLDHKLITKYVSTEQTFPCHHDRCTHLLNAGPEVPEDPAGGPVHEADWIVSTAAQGLSRGKWSLLARSAALTGGLMFSQYGSQSCASADRWCRARRGAPPAGRWRRSLINRAT